MGWTASDFERLDPRLFRSFLAVVNTHNFSSAAEAASLTQGAVSQQIAKLEDRLNAQLFVRAGTRVVMTPAAQMLAQYAQAYMDHASSFLEKLNEEFESLRGLVRYAMPESCIHAPHFGWLLERRKAHPDIVLNIEIKPSHDVLRDVANGAVDFGFVNVPASSGPMESYPFCHEEYVLLESAHAEPISLPASLDELLKLPIILYPGMMQCLNRWISVQYGASDPINAVALRVHGEFNDMRGALAMVEGDLGYAVMPQHVATPGLEAQRLRIVGQSSGFARPLPVRQQISIVRLKERRMPARVKRVIRWFLDMHTELQPVPQEFLT